MKKSGNILVPSHEPPNPPKMKVSVSEANKNEKNNLYSIKTTDIASPSGNSRTMVR